MKKELFIGLMSAIVMAGCNQDKIDRLSNTNDSLASVIAKKDSSMALIATTLADVHSNLNYIKEREGIIAINASSEGDTNQINNAHTDNIIVVRCFFSVHISWKLKCNLGDFVIHELCLNIKSIS